jgi:MoxR-like ATPase
MNIKLIDRLTHDFDPETYLVEEGLRHAAEVAFALRQPLLLMGEPGTGKTRFAQKLAHELAKQNASSGYHFLDKPLVFNTKTNSTARDLFYTYDALAHFQSANIRRDTGQAVPTTADFITLQAYGQAIAQTNPATVPHLRLREGLRPDPASTVVLIDEIDKAPRDFPNDLLNELDNQECFIRELDNLPLRRAADQSIVVVLTSNSEKNLPDAFLRRCVFYHIPFPDRDQLLAIARSTLGTETTHLDQLIEMFENVRKKALRKAPGTAEMLAWLRIVGLQNIQNLESADNKRLLRQNLSILVKTKEDYDAVKDLF